MSGPWATEVCGASPELRGALATGRVLRGQVAVVNRLQEIAQTLDALRAEGPAESFEKAAGMARRTLVLVAGAVGQIQAAADHEGMADRDEC